MNILPIVLREPQLLLIGAGPVAYQKAEVLQAQGIAYKQIAQSIESDFSGFDIKPIEKTFEATDIEGSTYIIDATGNENVTKKLLELKATHKFLLNVVDRPELCDFYFAALVRYGKLTVAVSSSGGSPTLAQEVRNKIKKLLPKSLDALSEKLFSLRQQAKIDRVSAQKESRKVLAKVTLIGCGTGDAELLTLKAYRCIHEIDVALIDHLVSEEIRELIPDTTLKIIVGKEKGNHSYKQEEINRLILEYASKGMHVGRLKSGDPYIFGRGAEEAIYIAEQGYSVEVIPGISSAIAGPLLAGIAPTARDYAASLSIVSGHLKGNLINLDWIELLLLKNHTTIVLMGISRVLEIVEAALAKGADKALPVAIISNASRPNQEIHIGQLSTLVELSKNSARPALLVFGNVVDLHNYLPKGSYAGFRKSVSGSE